MEKHNLGNKMDLNSLVRQAQRLALGTQTSNELPRLQRTLPHLLHEVEEMHSRVTRDGVNDIPAQMFFGARGIDISKMSATLESVKILTPNEDKEEAILHIIDEVIKKAFQELEQRNWKIHSEGQGENLNPETELNETSGKRSMLNRTELAYAREVSEYNLEVSKGGDRPNLAQKFSTAMARFEDHDVNEVWEMVKYMAEVAPRCSSRDPFQSRTEMNQFVDHAIKYLEDRYKIHLKNIICGSLLDVQREGLSSNYNLVSSFVGMTFNSSNCFGLQDHDTIDDKPLWPMVYYCLRSGDLDGALHCVRKCGTGHEDLVQSLQNKVNKQIVNSILTRRLKLHYCSKIKNSTDPYKKAVYCVFTGCDIDERHLKIEKMTDDYLWLQLSILRALSDDNSKELSLSNLQTTILEKHDETHFTDDKKNLAYFQALALTGQFKSAIEFLACTEKFRTHAVHIALALREMFLIRCLQQPLLSVEIEDPVPMSRLNVARLVMMYVKKFEVSDPAEALQYYFFLRHLKDSQGRNQFLVCVTNLTIECRNYEQIFGKMQDNGIVSGGLFDQFNCVEFSTRSAANMVAEELVEKRIYEDAIKLFEIAEIPNKSLYYLVVLLSEVVNQKSEKDSLRERLTIMAADFRKRLQEKRIQCYYKVTDVFNILLELVAFFDYYHEQNWALAMDKLVNMKLVPMSMDQVKVCLNNFERLDGEICKIYPDILLAAMNILYEQYKTVKAKIMSTNITPDTELEPFREKAKAITTMAAKVPYQMPREMSQNLIKIEALMN